MRPRQGDLVLVPVPFTDLSSHKRRPVIVVSSDAYNATVHVDRIYSLAQSLAVVRFGAVSRDIVGRIRDTLANALQ